LADDGLAVVPFPKGPPALAEFLDIDGAIFIGVAPDEPALHWLVQFFMGNMLIAVCVN
jgi:hypothetical protein